MQNISNNFSTNNGLSLTPNNNNKTENNFLNFSFSKPDNNNNNNNSNSNTTNTFNIINGGINNNNPINAGINSNNNFSIFSNSNSNNNKNGNNNIFNSTLNTQTNNNNYLSQNSNLNSNNNNSSPFNSILNTNKNNVNIMNTNNNNNSLNSPFSNLNNTWSFNLNNNYNDTNKIFPFNNLNNNYNINNNASFLANNNNNNIFNNNSYNIMDDDIFLNINVGNDGIIYDLQKLFNSTDIKEKNGNNIKNNKNNLNKKSVPLSQIISDQIDKENSNKEIIDKIFEKNYKNNLNNLSDNNYNYFNKNEFADGLSLYKMKKKKEKLRREEEKNYKKLLKNLYSNNEKEEIKEIILRNNKAKKVSKTQRISEKSNIENMSQKEDEKSLNETQPNLNSKINIENNDISKISKKNDNKPNNLNIKEKHIIIKNSNKNDDIDVNIAEGTNKGNIISNNVNDKKKEIDKNDSSEKLIYDISIIVKNKEDVEIFQKNISIDESTKYELDLDELFFMITSILKEQHISYKYGLSYKIGYMELEEKVGKINILNYDILSVSTEKDNKNTKKLDMEIKIINGNNLPSKDYIENPQLFCKLTKSYKTIPKLSIVNRFNLFEYNNGLKIFLEHLSIIFNKDETYDLAMVNFDEFSCNDDTEIFFDSNRFEKSNSTMKKICDNRIILTYDGIGTKYKDNLFNRNIVRDYFRKRYLFEKYKFDDFNKQIIISTKIKYLLISEEDSKIQYEEFIKNINK